MREAGRSKQRIIANLGRKEGVNARGDLDRLTRSLARLAQRSMVLSVLDGEAPSGLACRRIRPALLFERLWQETGCRDMLSERAAPRQVGFAIEHAVFLTVLHRLFVSGSDRAAEKWRADYRIDGSEGLRLHPLYRAMAWLGEPLGEAPEGALAPRCVKDDLEEALFARPTGQARGLKAHATCSANSAWRFSTPPACLSKARVARPSGGAAIPRTSARTSTRWWSGL